MRISVFGLGYVGTVSAACLATRGHNVIGVDSSKLKVDLINSGQSPVIEPQVGDMIKQCVCSGHLNAIQDAEEAILSTDVSFVSVGTPARANGSLELGSVRRVCEEIGRALAQKDRYHILVIRSTMLPGCMRSVVIPVLEQHSGKSANVDFGICFNPEFLREGSSVHDFFTPPKTVIGTSDTRTANIVREIYQGLPGEVLVTTLEISEMVKYADNSFHAIKITFANEIGMICKALGIDSHAVMEIFCKDHKLNISPYYLKPGFAFGGSCLPKDVSALLYKARTMDLDTPLLQSLLLSNEKQIFSVCREILGLGKKRVGFLGFSFKAGTDDLRGSPIVEVIETLIGKGCQVCLYDANVNVARLVGANQSYIDQRIPHIAALMCETIDEVMVRSDLIVVGNRAPEFREAINKVDTDKIVLDLVRVDESKRTEGNYIGLAW
jgi:GDP-mannose 6-dehydrogenase